MHVAPEPQYTKIIPTREKRNANSDNCTKKDRPSIKHVNQANGVRLSGKPLEWAALHKGKTDIT